MHAARMAQAAESLSQMYQQYVSRINFPFPILQYLFSDLVLIFGYVTIYNKVLRFPCVKTTSM